MKEEKLYSQKELEQAINEALENYKKAEEFKKIKERAFNNERY